MADDNPNAPAHEQSPAWQNDPYVGKPYGYVRPLPPSPSNGHDPFSGMPWWVRAIALVGVPALISLWLVWMNADGMSSTIASNGAKIAQVQSDMILHDQRVSARFEQLAKQSDAQTRILRSICQSVAKNDVQREKCSE